MSDSSRRSAEEREAARREREAARLERERRRAKRSPAAEEAAPVAPSEPAHAPSEPAHAPSEPAHAPEPVAAGGGYGHVDHEDWDDEYDDELDKRHDQDHDESHEAPVGIRTVARAERLRAGERSAASPARRPAKPRRRRRRSWFGRLLAVLAFALVIGALWFLNSLFQPFHGTGHGSAEVTIPPHSSVSQIGDILEHDGVIDSSFFFKLRASLAGDRSDLRAGTYHLTLGMGYGDVLTALTKAPQAAPTSNLTIIEGKSRGQVDALLRSQHLRGSYLAATRHSRLLNPRAYGAPRSTNTLEGFLFPSTFQLIDPISINALVADQLRTFRKEFATVSMSYAHSKHLTPFDVLTIASMVQAEAETSHDRPLVASVIYNRLHDHMPLQIDATTRFATGNYTSPLTVSELNSHSPYNTRTQPGLPPGPIDSPGLASIQAAAHPAQTSYLYFVVKPCGNGEHVFSSNYNQFLRDAAKYQAARTQRGGKSPEKC